MAEKRAMMDKSKNDRTALERKVDALTQKLEAAQSDFA